MSDTELYKFLIVMYIYARMYVYPNELATVSFCQNEICEG